MNIVKALALASSTILTPTVTTKLRALSLLATGLLGIAVIARHIVPTIMHKPFQCTDCGSVKGYASRPRNFIEEHILPVLGLRPVRCGDCFLRSYRPLFVIVRVR
jgi:hypothetical protein